jgi:hypothetical protein
MRSMMQTVVFVLSTFIAVSPAAFAGSGASNGCGSPPVTTAEQAVCLARADIESGWLGADRKQLKAEAFRHDPSTWVVDFRDTRPGVLGGDGHITIDVNSGKVTERRREQ